MDPSMIAMAQEMMSKMSPEQLAEMQRQAANMDPSQMQQAMNMFNSMTPEQRRQAQAAAANVPPEQLIQNANNAKSQLSAQQKYIFDASMQLKNDGNRLHGLQKYSEAAEKYSRALENLTSYTDAESAKLRLSCQSNLASCYLQLNQWQQCVDQCNAVLKNDSTNRKAYYRRGQALMSLQQYSTARQDLQKALELSPESEKAVIQEKLDDLEQKTKHATQGVVIEEIVEEDVTTAAAVDNSSSNNNNAVNVEEVVEDGTVEDVDIIENNQSQSSMPPPPSTTTPSSSLPQTTADQFAMATEALQRNPEAVKQTADAIAQMSDDDLARHIAQAGGNIPGATPEMARAAAEMMKNMSPSELQEMAQRASTLGGMPSFPTNPTTMPTPEAAAEALRRDPSALKTAAKMMENMTPQQLEAMTAAMPGVPGGMKIDAEQMKMAAKMMENMSPDDFERMSKLAQSMPGGGFPSSSSTSTSTTTGAANTTVTSNNDTNTTSTTSSNNNKTAKSLPTTTTTTNTLPTSRNPSIPGAAPTFDPGNISPEMMTQMRQQMANPEMLRSMQSMLKNMDSQTLASMMRASGMNMTPEQAQRMVDSMGNISDKQLAWIARLTAIINTIIMIYQTVKRWLFSGNAMSIAVIVLLIALIIRWLEWF